MVSKKDDTSTVQFQASRRSDSKLYSLEVSCADGLTEEEYADCLVAFANDIRTGEFTFEDAKDERFSQ